MNAGVEDLARASFGYIGRMFQISEMILFHYLRVIRVGSLQRAGAATRYGHFAQGFYYSRFFLKDY